MLNHFNFQEFGDKILVTNDLGHYAFITHNDFDLLVHNEITQEMPVYQELTDKLFIYDSHPEVFASHALEAMRRSKSYLFQSTSLFIFVLTNMCNAACVYCQAQDSMSLRHGKMSIETAKKAVDIALSSPADDLVFEFQGGEPFLNFDTLRFIVEYAEEQNKQAGKRIAFSLVSNLTLATDEIIEFLAEHSISVSTSIDGDPYVHNCNRPMRTGDESYDTVVRQYNKMREAGISLGAIETTTRTTLSRYAELIDTYISLGQSSVFIRPLTPLGIAKENWQGIGYTAEEYSAFYDKCIQYLLQRNKEGYRISEGHARIFLKKILHGIGINYMELRSPCGASIGQMAIYYDGRIFTCDEGRMLAEMGNDAFMLGTVDDSYDTLIENPVCKAACASSVLESIPSCSDCVFSPYCGTCPVINLAMDGDIFSRRPQNYRCKVYKGMMQVLFKVLEKNDPEEIRIFNTWIEEDDIKEEVL